MAIAIALVHPLGAAFVALRTTRGLCLEIHESLQRELAKLAEEIPIRVLLGQLQQCYILLGHRALSVWSSHNFQSTEKRDGPY